MRLTIDEDGAIDVAYARIDPISPFDWNFFYSKHVVDETPVYLVECLFIVELY